MGGAEVAAGEQILNQAGIPTFQFPDSAVRAFNYMWRYAYNLKGIYETPALPQHADAAVQRGNAERIIREVRQSGRTILTEYESKQLLQAYDIPTVETRIAVTEAGSARSRRRDRLPGRAEAVLPHHHPQDRRGRRAVEPPRSPRRVEVGFPGQSGSRSPKRPARSTSRA